IMMRRLLPFVFVSLLMVDPGAAQWLKYPTPGVPRDSAGKPNLSAPAPRASDGKPDLSGLWQLDASCGADVRCPAAQLGDYPVPPEFLDFGARLPGGLPYQPWAAALVKERRARFGADDPVTLCKPSAGLRLFTFPPPRKLLQTPGLVVLLSERDVTYRQIFTDGRPLPKDPEPSFNGYSTGRWTNVALIAETNGLQDGMWIDRHGRPVTEAAKT